MPKKLDRCVKRVKAQGKDEQAANAICSNSTGIKRKKGGGWKKTKKKVNESMEKKRMVEFIKNIIDKDFSAANASLQRVVDEKIKTRIRNYESEVSEDTEKDTENQ